MDTEGDLAKLEAELGTISRQMSTEEISGWEFDALEQDLKASNSPVSKDKEIHHETNSKYSVSHGNLEWSIADSNCALCAPWPTYIWVKIMVDEDYIELELSSSTNFYPYPIASPHHSREFEFHLSSISQEKESKTSPADELFYKGKLLPLHLPPRLQMVQKLLQSSNTTFASKVEAFEEQYHTSFITSSAAPSTNASTPLESSNISPSESCRVSCELNPDECFFGWSNEVNGFIGDHPKKSWTKKLKQSSLGQKLKASRAYIKSLFSKSGCSDESCAEAANDEYSENASKGKECLYKYMKVVEKSPFGLVNRERYWTPAKAYKIIDRDMAEYGINSHRRSFSSAIKRHSPSKSSSSCSSASSSSSSSFSFNSHGFYDLHLLKRSSSANSELESSIEGAIAHCKRSQQQFSSKDCK
ncbi:hypothetical protein RJ641_024824 [Dillenia turbinata]|uniref:Membrane-associated kinase regulator 4 n=1 Tax=Dillenia turbinata TaxID=194707 RepID=A0AAN8WD57_9MAGN